MKTFLRAFYKSVADPIYYKDVLAAKPRFSIKYYIILSLILTAVNSIAGTLNYAPAIKHDLTESAKELTQNFPQDLKLTINSSGITANKDFPLIVQTPAVLDGLPKNLVIIDPKGEVGMLQKYDALILINNSYVIIENGDNIQTAPLKEFPEISIDNAKIQSFAQTLLFIAQHAQLFLMGFFVVTGLFNLFVWRLFYLAVFALGIWLTYRSTVGSYAKAFQVGLHSITLPLLISTTLGIAAVHIPFLAWFILVHTVFTFYVLGKLEKKASLFPNYKL